MFQAGNKPLSPAAILLFLQFSVRELFLSLPHRENSFVGRNAMNGIKIAHVTSSFLAACFLVFFSCKKDSPPEPPNGPKPGKREYVWTVDTIAYPGSFQTTMRDIWASAPNNVYVVGHNDQNRGQMYRYDGASWQPVRLAASDGGTIIGPFDLSAVYGFAPNDIYAVGEHIYQNPTPPPNFLDSSLIIHFDGTQWREVQLPFRSRYLQAIGTTGGTDLWAGGIYGALYRHGAGSWGNIPCDTLFWFNDFGSDGQELLAVAYYVPPLGGSITHFLLRWTVSQWQVVDSFSVRAGFVARFGNDALSTIGGKLYSVGYGVFLKDGQQWTRVMDSNPVELLAISGTRGEHIFAVGQAMSIYHFNGVNWYKYEQFVRGGAYCSGVWCTENEVFAVGSDGNRTFIFHGK
jgi:hypothetical protein